MKKQYFRLKVKLVIVVVLCLLAGCMVLTYHKAIQIREEYVIETNKKINEALGDFKSYPKSYSPRQIAHRAYSLYYNVSGMENVGFYSMLKNLQEETLAKNQYFMYVQKPGQDDNIRIVLLGEDFFCDDADFKLDYSCENFYISYGTVADHILESGSIFSSIEITGTCDRTYIYPEKITWVDSNGKLYTYVPEESNIDKGSETFEEWAGSDVYEAELGWDNKFYVLHNSVTYAYGDEEKAEKLNAEAEKKCNQLYDDFINGKDASINNNGLFTCEIAGVIQIVDEYNMPYMFVYHPVSMAMEELTGIYIGVALLGIMIITILYIIINNVYKQQFAYEMNRRELTRGIAHELKTPLAITKGYVENWQYMDENERKKCSQTITAEIEHMNTMVMDLLELSRLEAKHKEMNPESVDVHSLAKSVLGRMKEIIVEKGLQVNVIPQDGEFLVNADLEMMRTVLVNFVTNAVKYADKKIDINISENVKKIKFTITNDGRTIDAKKLAKVWDEFYRDGYSNDHHMGSSGLGLAITKNILILHEAKYGCKSQNGKTEFWFEMKKSAE